MVRPTFSFCLLTDSMRFFFYHNLSEKLLNIYFLCFVLCFLESALFHSLAVLGFLNLLLQSSIYAGITGMALCLATASSYLQPREARQWITLCLPDFKWGHSPACTLTSVSCDLKETTILIRKKRCWTENKCYLKLLNVGDHFLFEPVGILCVNFMSKPRGFRRISSWWEKMHGHKKRWYLKWCGKRGGLPARPGEWGYRYNTVERMFTQHPRPWVIQTIAI